MNQVAPYTGRFAPSPTGPLHFGSLVAAVGSYLQARQQQGKWLLRIDDIDPKKKKKGAADNIIRTLEQFGFEWDEQVLYQSARYSYYQDVVDDLVKQKLAYPCSCSRNSILKKTGQQKGEIIYPGFCRNGPLKKSSTYSIRLRTKHEQIRFNDTLMGAFAVDLENEQGDFIIQRRDRFFSYHLASAIDDAEQGITEVVRGSDLLNCTASQLYVQQVLNLTSPQYCHLPLAINPSGQKLSKQNHARAIDPQHAVRLLVKTLKFLGQMPSKELITTNKEEVWNWAIKHWRLELVPLTSQQTIY